MVGTQRGSQYQYQLGHEAIVTIASYTYCPLHKALTAGYKSYLADNISKINEEKMIARGKKYRKQAENADWQARESRMGDRLASYAYAQAQAEVSAHHPDSPATAPHSYLGQPGDASGSSSGSGPGPSGAADYQRAIDRSAAWAARQGSYLPLDDPGAGPSSCPSSGAGAVSFGSRSGPRGGQSARHSDGVGPCRAPPAQPAAVYEQPPRVEPMAVDCGEGPAYAAAAAGAGASGGQRSRHGGSSSGGNRSRRSHQHPGHGSGHSSGRSSRRPPPDDGCCC